MAFDELEDTCQSAENGKEADTSLKNTKVAKNKPLATQVKHDFDQGFDW